ncbi:MAG: hypothetical protein LBJ44_07545 [Propionibacteriaceae bacterium]|jgi:hypothetical protein|nr:hypothetical protein [Propionibacteriaceae bacterium]
MKLSQERVLADLVDALGQVMGQDTIAVLRVDERTRVFGELELGSIEMVQVLDVLSDRYPLGDEFLEWLAQKPALTLARLRVGDIVRHIVDASD